MPTPVSTLDNCLNGMIREIVTRVDVCNAEPATYAEATNTYSLAFVAVDSSDFILADGDTDGRKVSLAVQSGVTINTPGTATHLAFTDGSTLRHATPCGSIALTTPATVNLAAFDILEINTFGQYSVVPADAYVAITADAGAVQVVGALPEGNSGIAANYTNDIGIAGDGAVVFADTFETYTTASDLTTANWDNYYQGGNTLIDTGVYFTGAKSLRQRMPASGGEVSNAIVKTISPDLDEIFVRAYTRYQSGYTGVNAAHNGIRITANYTGPGTIPDGTDFMYAGIENSRYRGEAEPGQTNAYVYHPEQNDNYGEHWYPSGFTSNGDGPNGGFGTNFVSRSDAVPTTGTWICREVYLKLNTPGQRDGRLAFWDDGVLMADWGNIRWRDNTSVKIDEIQFENGGQGSTQINDRWTDNVVVASSYIGPLFPGIVPAEAAIVVGADPGAVNISGVVTPAEASIIVAADAGSVAMTGGGETINAASASQADVTAAISAASAGDTVQVPAGNANWSGLTISKAISLVGNGIGSTNITLTGGNTVTKQAAGPIYVRGFSFTKSGGGNESYGFYIGGTWLSSDPVVFEGNDFNISGSALFNLSVIGGVVIARNSFTGGWDDSLIKPKSTQDTESWSTASTMGMDDSTGKANLYVEDNTFYGGTNQGIDADDACRCVYRYNTLLYSSFNTHGWATSQIGVRHFEVYNNDFQHNQETTQIANQNWCIWIRGGTGLIFNNYFDNIAGSWWGDKDEIKFSIRGAEDSRPQGACGNVSYPVPRQIGQSHNGTNYITDPIYIYSNAGAQGIAAGWNWGNPCGLTFSDFWQSGRDYVLNSGAKPGYTAYTYPHPLRTIGDSGTNGYRP